MSTASELLDKTAPDTLTDGRIMAHNAAQTAALAALANLEPRSDYSHNSLTWNASSGGFQTNPMESSAGPFLVRVTLAPLSMWIVRGGETIANLELNDVSQAHCLSWLDEALVEHQLKPASEATHPFKLPKDVDAVTEFKSVGLEAELLALSRWYDLASRQLLSFAARNKDITPGPGPVYCWPHHFDIATYVSLDGGGSEETPGVGVGMSPGDRHYGEPYFYINPWPRPDNGSLPALPAPGHWHKEGFVGAVATASQILTLEDRESGLADFIDEAFAIGRKAAGA